MKHFIVTAFGSAGDVNPCIWLARQTVADGHKATLVTSAAFEKSARRAGVECVPVGTTAEYESLIENPRLWLPNGGPKQVVRYLGRQFRPSVHAIETIAEQSLAAGTREIILVSPPLMFGPKIVSLRKGYRLITVHHNPPGDFRRVRRAGFWGGMRTLLGRAKRFLLNRQDVLETMLLPNLRRECRALGVVCPAAITPDWWTSQHSVWALFPEWFAPREPHWPAHLQYVGFPIYDPKADEPLSGAIEAFLKKGPPPILFTFGAAMRYSRRFFEVALESICRLHHRAILLTPFTDQLPVPLPEEVISLANAPFPKLFPHLSLLVHHAGIGTAAPAFAAGVPQLLMPMTHDQPGNAHRIVQLGVGSIIRPEQFRDDTVCSTIEGLLRDESCRQACLRVQEFQNKERPEERLVELLENL